MTDIVERLRELEQVEHELAHDCDYPPEATANWKYAETCREAAAEIERLRAALLAFADHFGPLEGNPFLHEGALRCFALARAALEGK